MVLFHLVQMSAGRISRVTMLAQPITKTLKLGRNQRLIDHSLPIICLQVLARLIIATLILSQGMLVTFLTLLLQFLLTLVELFKTAHFDPT